MNSNPVVIPGIKRGSIYENIKRVLLTQEVYVTRDGVHVQFYFCRYSVYSYTYFLHSVSTLAVHCTVIPTFSLLSHPSPYITLINTRRRPLTRFIDKRTRLIRADFSHLKNIIMLGMQMYSLTGVIAQARG